jgi:phage terminase large subunit-like protein
MSPATLRLRAEDEEDLAVFSACLQDALAPVGDMEWLREERRFVLVVNRFRWECKEKPAERTLTGIRFDEIEDVKVQGFARTERTRILELLAIRREGAATVLEFADGARLRLEAPRIRGVIEDMGEPWPTRWRPRHPFDGA